MTVALDSLCLTMLLSFCYLCFAHDVYFYNLLLLMFWPFQFITLIDFGSVLIGMPNTKPNEIFFLTSYTRQNNTTLAQKTLKPTSAKSEKFCRKFRPSQYSKTDCSNYKLKCAHRIQCSIEIAPSHGEYVDIYQQVIEYKNTMCLVR